MMLRGGSAGYSPNLLILIAYFSFVSIGIQTSLLGIAWTGPEGPEYLSRTFRQPLDGVGQLLAAGTLGYFLVSAVSGRLVQRFGVGRVLAFSMLAAAMALGAFPFAPYWGMVVLAAFVHGAGSGLMDATMNIYFAAHHGVRLMNWLHACFGIGTTIGPFVISTSLAQTGSWRTGYMVAACVHGTAALLYFLSQRSWAGPRPAGSDPPQKVRARETLRLPLVWVGIGLFLAYTGLEMSMGQWGYALFSLARGVPEMTAAQWVSLYWGSFTAGRILFGAIGERFVLEKLIKTCLLGALASSLLLVFSGASAWTPLAVVLFGVSISPIWAMLIVHTQRVLGPDHAPHAIGYQVAAASLGFGLIPSLAGVLADSRGLEVIPWILVGLTAWMVGLYAFDNRPSKKAGTA